MDSIQDFRKVSESAHDLLHEVRKHMVEAGKVTTDQDLQSAFLDDAVEVEEMCQRLADLISYYKYSKMAGQLGF